MTRLTPLSLSPAEAICRHSAFLLSLMLMPMGHAAAQDQLDLVTHEFPPYSFEGSDGSAKGSYVDLISSVCQKAGLSCSIRVLPFRRASAELAEGLAMGHFPLGWNKERMEKMYFSVPLQHFEYGFFVPKGAALSAPWPKAMAGKSVGVVGPSNTEKALRVVQAEQESAGLTPMSVKVFATETGQAAQMVAEGRLDASFANRDTTQHFVNKLGVKGLSYAGRVNDGLYVIGFNKEKTKLATIEKFNRAAIELMGSQGLAGIAKRWEASVPPLDLAAWDKMGMPR